MTWHEYDKGLTIGQPGSENGIIIRDEEHTDGARITIERASFAPFALTCGIYGWMVHPRYFGTESESQTEFEKMKEELDKIIILIPSNEESQNDQEFFAKSQPVLHSIRAFVEKFP